jgi:uncharacterized BrkB/YihY/UPF0761 family membrane protein
MIETFIKFSVDPPCYRFCSRGAPFRSDMRGWRPGWISLFSYWIQTEVHIYSFSVAANVLLSFFPFLIVMLSLPRRVFGQQALDKAGSARSIDRQAPGTDLADSMASRICHITPV